MKFPSASASLLVLAFSAASVNAGENPDCLLIDTGDDAYKNCRTEFFIQAPSSDAMWCISESDCAKVFPDATVPPVPSTAVSEKSISAIEEQVSSSTMLSSTLSAVVLVAASTMMLLC